MLLQTPRPRTGRITTAVMIPRPTTASRRSGIVLLAQSCSTAAHKVGRHLGRAVRRNGHNIHGPAGAESGFTD
jgi:hypothetical protein